MTSARAMFRSLHEAGIFVMPNPWDPGSARILENAGFPALATTSAGFGRSIGKDDQEVSRDELVDHVADLVSVIRVPLNVDSERLFPEEPGGIAETVRLLAHAGASGCSIEDYDPATQSIGTIETAAEAVAEAAAGADVLYAPGLRTAADIGAVVEAAALPINVLAVPDGPSIPELGALGVRRVSIGSSMYNATIRALRTAASEIIEHGTSHYAR